MTYAAYFGFAAIIAITVALRAVILNSIPAFKRTYRPDRRIEGGALLMIGSLLSLGWLAGFVTVNTLDLLMIAGPLLALVGFAVFSVGILKEAKQWF